MDTGMSRQAHPMRSFLLTLLALVVALVFWLLPPTQAHSESGPAQKPLAAGPSAPPAPAPPLAPEIPASLGTEEPDVRLLETL